MNKYLPAMLMLFTTMASADCLNDIKSGNDLIQSNICTYQNTVLAKIDSVSLDGWYNPATYFKPHRIYNYSATVQEIYKGTTNTKMCFFQWREGSFSNMESMVGVNYIISFNNNYGCSLIDVGGMLPANKELIQIARQHGAK